MSCGLAAITEKRQPRVEASWNTSTAVPANRKRRRRGKPVLDEMVMYGYWSSVIAL
jgi:hypothetical protein